MNQGYRVIAGVAVLCGVACSSATDTNPQGQFGTVYIRVTQAPADVSCISASAMGATSVTTRFDVAAGGSTVLTMARVPVGTVSFSAEAFNVACVNVGTQAPTWISNAVTTNVTSGTPVFVTLSMTQNGSAQISLDFPASPTCGASGAVCNTPGSQGACCAGLTCTQGQTGTTCQQATTCNAVGVPCMLASDCCSGICTGGVCQQAPTCKLAGGACMAPTDCCSPLACIGGVCQQSTTCNAVGALCMLASDCCSGICTGGVCQQAPTCGAVAAPCMVSTDCCAPLACLSGKCQSAPACQPTGAACMLASDCCSAKCVGAVCQ